VRRLRAENELKQGKERQQFFFEKKHPKTFTLIDKSFLVLFFKKELLPYFLSTHPNQHAAPRTRR
jgi:hypothetical protein